jgi:hypothetical protein
LNKPITLGRGKRVETAGIVLIPFKLQKRGRMISKKPTTKTEVVSFFAMKFEISPQKVAEILDDVAGLAIFEALELKSFTFPGISNLVLSTKKEPTRGRKATTKVPARTAAGSDCKSS